MSVTFSRKSLIKVATAALTEHEKALSHQAVAIEKLKKEHAVEHTEDTRANAKRLRDCLTALLKKQGPNELKLLGLKNLGPVFAAAASEVGKAVGK